jgi:hypothetical protein
LTFTITARSWSWASISSGWTPGVVYTFTTSVFGWFLLDLSILLFLAVSRSWIPRTSISSVFAPFHWCTFWTCNIGSFWKTLVTFNNIKFNNFPITNTAKEFFRVVFDDDCLVDKDVFLVIISMY